MRNTAKFLALFATAFFAGGILSAQCVPDTANCTDTDEPGQFCPDNLPKAGLNVLYDEVVTVIPPRSYEIMETEVNILYIEIDSVKNLPPGISYFPNATRLYPDTAYCIQLTGTPTQIGEYPLAIHILATAEIFGGIVSVPVVDTSSIVITVVEVLGINPNQFGEGKYGLELV